jgi:hypothetical protein
VAPTDNSTNEPALVSRYFQLDAARDIEAIVALFTDDASVVDERETHQGTAAIRAWRQGPASKYEYTVEIVGGEAVGRDRYIATGRITGNFPGGTADLKWDFTLTDGLLSRLVIAPP